MFANELRVSQPVNNIEDLADLSVDEIVYLYNRQMQGRHLTFKVRYSNIKQGAISPNVFK